MPLSVEGLRGQGVEQFGRSEAFVFSLPEHLSFLDHVHEFNPDQSALSCLERFDPQHRPGHPLDCSMVLFHDVVEVLHLPDADGGAVFLVVAFDRGFVGVTAVDRNGLGYTVATNRLFQKPQGGLCIPVLGEQKVNGLAVSLKL